MTLANILEESDISPNLRAQMQDFDLLCHQLSALTDRENNEFMSESFRPDSMLTMQKITMLRAFEQQAPQLSEMIETQVSGHQGLQRYFVEIIESLQNKLRINTSLQLHTMGQLQRKGSGLDVCEQREREACH